jgi:hypothetical protein
MYLDSRISELGDVYWALGDEKWRESFELCLHGHGPDVFAHGKGPTGAIEPEFGSSIALATKFVASTLGERMTTEIYTLVHYTACMHEDGAICGGVWYPCDERGQFREAGFNLTSLIMMDSPLSEDRLDWLRYTHHVEAILERSGFHVRYWVPDMDRDSVASVVSGLFRDFHHAIEIQNVVGLHGGDCDTSDTKLGLIAQLFCDLEYFHAFYDGNTRTNVLVLQKLLVETGFCPAIMNHWELLVSTPDDAIGLLRTGMDRWMGLVRKSGALL